MDCPLCGEHCTCSYVATLRAENRARAELENAPDSEEYDRSEERFAASLEARAEEAPAAEVREPEEKWTLVAAAAAPAAARQQDTFYRPEPPSYWRQEVVARVESYRARRRRPRREGSLSLDFERAANRAVTQGESEAEQEWPTSVDSGQWSAGSDQAQALEQDAAPEVIQEELESNIIEFPAPQLPLMPPSGEELAEPVLDRPRILEAPEEVATATAPLGGIQLDAEEEEPGLAVELPLQVATMSQRAFAGLLDALMVVVGTAVFLMIAMRENVPMPEGKAVALVLALPCFFWAVYEYLFLVYAGRTPGMQMGGLRLVNFDGAAVPRRVRRGRALAMVLSSLSLGLGLVWALLDEDTLCWHDRISRTYVVSG